MDIWTFGSELFTDGLFYFVLHGLTVWLLARFFWKVIQRSMSRVYENGKKNQIMFQYLSRTVHAVIYGLALFSILSKIKPLQSMSTALLSVSSILAVILGIAAQSAFGNYISGVFLAVHQPFQVGDFITLPEKNISGTVTEINFRQTEIRTPNNTVAILPNSIMDNAVIINKQRHELDYVEYMNVNVAYDSDIALARKTLMKVLTEDVSFQDKRTEQQKKSGVPAVNIGVWDLGDSGIQLHFPVYAKNYLDSLNVCSRIREEILKQFRENSIVIPYQTITVEQDPSQTK